ncbi:hypothetical protein G7084_00930 [Weissella coleopterorum]|uniref:Sugar specific permease n=1 Tax=Weissella coleopterorum TaxID=2714949 RepID=A0A6G8AYG6_9LACO|nr:hypothetical protein [Weissella coleopterorum]QIL50009.1 hypothetical protein G7084_00930 [Weissella coleopterorum]
MYIQNNQTRPLKGSETILFLLLGLFYNGLGNGLAVATNMGSAAWTAAATNLQAFTLIPKGYFLFTFGILAALTLILLTKEISWPHLLGNLIFVSCFSYLVNFSSQMFAPVIGAPLWLRIILDLISIIMVGTGVSITMRVNVITHPLDDLVLYTRFKYLHGNAFVAQVINFTFPLIISLTIWYVSGTIKSVNLGTLISFFGQGLVIGWADTHVIRSLTFRKNF